MTSSERNRRLHHRRTPRAAGFAYGKLEPRMAPGSLLDLFSLMANGSGESDRERSTVPTAAQRWAEPLMQRPDGLASRVTFELTSSAWMTLPTVKAPSSGDRSANGASQDPLEAETRLNHSEPLLAQPALALNTALSGWNRNGLLEGRFGNEWQRTPVGSDRSEPMGKSIGNDRPSTANATAAVAPKSSSATAMASSRSEPISNASSLVTGVSHSSTRDWSGYLSDVSSESSAATGALWSGIMSATATDSTPQEFQGDPNEHRLPPELRGRSDRGLSGKSLFPYPVQAASQREPVTGLVRSPSEYEPMRGVLYSYASYPTIVTDMVKELTEDASTDDIAYVVVNSETQRTTATNSFVAAGANLSRVQFFVQPMDSVWIRDYGPHFITVDQAPAIVDSHYYPTRALDNFIPTLVGDNNFRFPTYDMGLYFSGGNFQPGPNRSGFLTSIINRDNPTADGFDSSLIAELHQKYLGIDTMHVMPALPTSVDGTGHIDMWMYLVDQNTVVISEFLAGSNSTAIQITNNAVGYMQNLGYEVFRTPAWNSGSTHFTYANAFRVNNRIFVPVYGTAFKPGGNSAYNSYDTAAMQAWQAAAGAGVEIIPIQCSQIIPASGAIHCIVKQVPRYTGSAPAVDLIAPAGGEILSRFSPFKLEWSAIDNQNTDPAEIRLSVSYGNREFQPIATTTDTGSYLWTPVGGMFDAEPVRIKIVAQSSNGNTTEVISRPFFVALGNLLTYDFSSGAGINKFAYGSQTASWASINGNPFPISTQLTSTNYSRLATSNATGGNDADTNRYIAPVPSPSSNESTHLFTFQLDSPVDQIAQLDMLWEGYGDFSTQVELYVWDLVAGNWGDGMGRTGVNRYLDSWAGNLDGFLTGSLRSNLSRYVDKTGLVRFLVYTDRPGAVGSTGQGIETFHDCVSLKVKEFSRRLG